MLVANVSSGKAFACNFGIVKWDFNTSITASCFFQSSFIVKISRLWLRNRDIWAPLEFRKCEPPLSFSFQVVQNIMSLQNL